MLNFLTLGAALATVFNISLNESLLASTKNSNNQSTQASTPNLVANAAIPDPFANSENFIALADTSNTRDTDEGNPTGMLVGLAAAGSIAAGVALGVKNSKPSAKSSSYHGASKQIVDQASRDLRKKLLRLLHEDEGAANRLVSQVQRHNPNRSVDWCVDKVIYDLKRDRGGY